MSELRHEYQEELDLLARRIDVLFGEVENSVQRACTALFEGDRELADETIKHDDLIDELTVSIEEEVIAVIARQAPVATDLRYVLSVLRVAADLERCGDLALRVAKQTFNASWMARAEQLRPLLKHLGEGANSAIGLAAEAWADRNGDAWQDIEQIDLDVDQTYERILEELRDLESSQTGEVAVQAVIAAQALERISDHAVSIAQRLRYLVTGGAEGLVAEISPLSSPEGDT